MKRTGFDEYRDQKTADQFGVAMHPCSECGRPTEYATMVSYGARCGICFNQWVTRGVRYDRILSADDRRALLSSMAQKLQSTGGKAWAYALKDREEAGEKLSMAQRDTWRRAVGSELDHA